MDTAIDACIVYSTIYGWRSHTGLADRRLLSGAVTGPPGYDWHSTGVLPDSVALGLSLSLSLPLSLSLGPRLGSSLTLGWRQRSY